MRLVRATSYTVLSAAVVALSIGCGAENPTPTTPISPVPPVTVDPPAAWPEEATFAYSGGPQTASQPDPVVDENFIHLVSTFDLPGAVTSERIIPIQSSSLNIAFAENTVSITGMSVLLPDIIVGMDTFPPDGIVITALELSADDALDVPFEAIDENLRYVETAMTVRLTWGLLNQNGDVYYLAPMTITGIPTAVALERNPETNHIRATIEAVANDNPIVNALVTVHEAGLSLALDAE